MRFEIKKSEKRMVFDSDLHGLRINGTEYTSGDDGVLIYDQINDVKANEYQKNSKPNVDKRVDHISFKAVLISAWIFACTSIQSVQMSLSSGSR